MTRRRIVLAVLLLCLPGVLTAQSGHVGPSSTRPQIVYVRAMGTGQPEKAVAYGAGIVVGHDGGGILVLTARHVVDRKFGHLLVGIGPEEKHVKAHVLFVSDSTTDLAVLRIAHERWYSRGRWRRDAPRILAVEHSPLPGEQVFALGCPMTACWAPPLEGRIARLRKDEILVRLPSQSRGLSGGALVDDRGVIIGIFAGWNSAGLVSVVPWRQAVEWLRRHGLLVNLPTRTLEQTGNLLVEATVAEFPVLSSGENEAQTEVQIGMKVRRSYEFLIGYLRLENASGSIRPLDHPPDQFSGSFFSYGVRYTRPTVVLLRGQPPMTVFVGLNGLAGGGHQVLRLEALPDSFDLRTGEQAYRRSPSVVMGGGWSASVGTRIYLRGGVYLRASATKFRLDLPPGLEDFEGRTRAELGVGALGRFFHNAAERGP